MKLNVIFFFLFTIQVTGKLLEACGAVAAASLEQTTWLRRNLSVRRDLNMASPGDETEEPAESMSSSSDGSLVDMAVSVNPASTSNAAQYSIQALFVLAELLAPLQDLAFVSQDKERVIPLLTSLLANVIPYLKHHRFIHFLRRRRRRHRRHHWTCLLNFFDQLLQHSIQGFRLIKPGINYLLNYRADYLIDMILDNWFSACALLMCRWSLCLPSLQPVEHCRNEGSVAAAEFVELFPSHSSSLAQRRLRAAPRSCLLRRRYGHSTVLEEHHR